MMAQADPSRGRDPGAVAGVGRVYAVMRPELPRPDLEYDAFVELFRGYSCYKPDKLLFEMLELFNIERVQSEEKGRDNAVRSGLLNPDGVGGKRTPDVYDSLLNDVMGMLTWYGAWQKLMPFGMFLRNTAPLADHIDKVPSGPRLAVARRMVCEIRDLMPRVKRIDDLLQSFDVEKKSTVKESGKPGAPSAPHYRRGSFLYRIDSDSELAHCPPTRQDQQHGEELIVTPFAQVLATLRNVRENIVSLTQGSEKAGSSSQRSQEVLLPARSASGSRTASDEPSQQLVHSTLMELDWCLEQLEAIQTHRSVSEMTSSKFRKMLTKELSQFSDSKSGDQLSRFIFTFMGHDDDLELASEKQKQGATVDKKAEEDKPPGSSTMMVKGKQHVTSSMSHISGVRKLKRSPTGAEETVAAAINEPTLIACTGKYNPDLAHCIDEIDRWGMDIFKLHRLCDSHSLTVVTFTIMKNRGLIKEFRLNTTKLLSYLLHLEDHYRQNSYHNSTHAADVTQTVHAMLNAPSVNSAFTDLEKFAVIIAAAIHDVDHPGLTNQFLVNSGSELAIMYNDESVLEQHHLAVAFKLLQESDCDILTGLTQKHRQLFRRIVIDTVLATDMSKHMSLLADLKTMVETKKLSGPGLPKLEKYGDRIQVLQNLIHIADLSNPAKPLALYEQWVDRLLEEYWAQGDKEKELGLEVSPMCDRQNVSREKSQVGFIDYIVHPLMETWADLVYPDGQHILDQLERNRNSFFLRLTEKDQEEFPPAV